MPRRLDTLPQQPLRTTDGLLSSLGKKVIPYLKQIKPELEEDLYRLCGFGQYRTDYTGCSSHKVRSTYRSEIYNIIQKDIQEIKADYYSVRFDLARYNSKAKNATLCADGLRASMGHFLRTNRLEGIAMLEIEVYTNTRGKLCINPHYHAIVRSATSEDVDISRLEAYGRYDNKYFANHKHFKGTSGRCVHVVKETINPRKVISYALKPQRSMKKQLEKGKLVYDGNISATAALLWLEINSLLPIKHLVLPTVKHRYAFNGLNTKFRGLPSYEGELFTFLRKNTTYGLINEPKLVNERNGL